MKIISLFSGIGGLDLGFEMAGHQAVFANDIMNAACLTYLENFGQNQNAEILTPLQYEQQYEEQTLPDLPIVKGNISGIEHFPPAEIVTGGFPCQGFSMIGTRLETDPRNQLYLEFSRVVNIANPKIFVAENVKGLLQLYGGRVFEAIKEEFAQIGKHGYTVQSKLLNAKNYGVPQDRERVIIVGVRNDLEFEYKYPEPSHGDESFFGGQFNGQSPYRTLKDAIGNLSEPHPEEIHSGKFSPLYMSRNRKRKWDQVSFTIQANAMHVPLHPSSCDMVKVETDKFVFSPEGGIYRRLTPRECATIQSFPKDFRLTGTIQKQYTQIGNAVPPLLARAVAGQIPLKL
jgi:DNA (cytosine-5)-methyltransferase 1